MAICVHRSLGAVSLWCACCRLSQITGLWGVSISISISQFANINASSLWLFEKCSSHVSDLPFTLADLSFPLFTTWVSVSSFFFFYSISPYLSRGIPSVCHTNCQGAKASNAVRFADTLFARAWPPYQYPFTWMQFEDKNARRLFAVKLSALRVAK